MFIHWSVLSSGLLWMRPVIRVLRPDISCLSSRTVYRITAQISMDFSDLFLDSNWSLCCFSIFLYHSVLLWFLLQFVATGMSQLPMGY